MKAAAFVLLALLSGVPPAAATDVVVRILSLHPPATLTLVAPGGGRARLGTRAAVFQRMRLEAGAQGIRVSLDGGPSAGVDVVTAASPEMRLGERRFSGSITFRTPDHATLYAINRTDLEDYVAGVVASEALPGAPLEAQAAQAVAARSYAVALAHLDSPHPAPLGPHADEGYDFCDLTHCQSFRGVGSGVALEATRRTRGQLVRQHGRVVATWYHSTCGGRTADPADVGADAALRSVSDVGPDGRAWCQASPHFRWRLDVPATKLLAALNSDGETAPGQVLQDVRVASVLPDGRAGDVVIVGQQRHRVSGETLWQVVGRALGWGQLESAWFTLRREAGCFHFEGRGLGHGVGMCQYGSVAMARGGWNMQRILRHYYPDTEIR